MGDVGIGLIGTGFMGKCHALAWNAVRPVFGGVRPRLEVLCDNDAARRERLADDWNFARSTPDWRAVVEDPRVSIVSTTAPNDLHREIALAALAQGKHVWCEKPMGVSLADAEAMAQAAAATPAAKTLLGYNYLRNPALAHAAKLIQQGVIGRVFDFRGQVDEDYLADGSLPWSWRMQADEAGLGVLGDITVHLISVAMLLVGPLERVAATTRTVHATRPLSTGAAERAVVDAEDVAHALIRFKGGASGVIGSSRVAHGRKNMIRIEAHGERGMIVFDQERMNELELFVAEGASEQRGFREILSGPDHFPYASFCPAPGHQLGFNELKVIEAAHLLACIERCETPYPDFATGLHIERAVYAMARSARDGAWVSI